MGKYANHSNLNAQKIPVDVSRWTKIKSYFWLGYYHVKASAKSAGKSVGETYDEIAEPVERKLDAAGQAVQTAYRESGLKTAVDAVKGSMMAMAEEEKQSMLRKAASYRRWFQRAKDWSKDASRKVSNWYRTSNLKLAVTEAKPYVRKAKESLVKTAKTVASGTKWLFTRGIPFLYYGAVKAVAAPFHWAGSKLEGTAVARGAAKVKEKLGWLAGKAAKGLSTVKEAIAEKYNDMRYAPDMPLAEYKFALQEQIMAKYRSNDYDNVLKLRKDLQKGEAEGDDLMQKAIHNIKLRKDNERLVEQYHNQKGNGTGAIELKDFNEDGTEVDAEKEGKGFAQNVGASNLGKAAIVDAEGKPMEAGEVIKAEPADKKTQRTKVGFEALEEEEEKAQKAEQKIEGPKSLAAQKLQRENEIKKIQKHNAEMQSKAEEAQKDPDVMDLNFKNVMTSGKKLAAGITGKIKTGAVYTGLFDLKNEIKNSFADDSKKEGGKKVEKPRNSMGKAADDMLAVTKKISLFGDYFNMGASLEKIESGEATMADELKATEKGIKLTKATLQQFDPKFENAGLDKAGNVFFIANSVNDMADAVKNIQDNTKTRKTMKDYQSKEFKELAKQADDKRMAQQLDVGMESRKRQLKTDQIGNYVNAAGAALNIADGVATMGSHKLAAKGIELASGKIAGVKELAMDAVDYVKKNYWDDHAVYVRDIFGTQENYDKCRAKYNLSEEDFDREIVHQAQCSSYHNLADKARAEEAMQIASNQKDSFKVNTKEYLKKTGLDKGASAEEIYKGLGGSGRINNPIHTKKAKEDKGKSL